MKDEFWLERWEEGRTPWHEGAINAALMCHVDCLELQPGETVFVPLCGKSEDMWWLQTQGFEVLGVDLSPIAGRTFLEAHGVEFTETRHQRHTVLDSPGFRLFAGDFFALAASDLAGVRAVYDRAALVALPPDVRQRYAQRLCELCDAPILLVCLAYPAHEIDGPPFSLEEAEVRALFGDRRRVRHLGEEDILTRSDLRNRGVTRLAEHAYLVT